MTTQTQTASQTTKQTAAKPQRPMATPAVDVFENQDAMLILADLPGVAESDLDVRVERNQLFVTGPAVTLDAHTGRELAFDWKRTFSLPQDVDTAAITAELKQGVLQLRLPRQEALKARQIVVKAG